MRDNTKREVKNRFDKLIIKSVVFVFVFLFVSVFSFLFNSSNNSVYAAGTTSTSTITISTAGTVDVSVTPTTSGTSATSTAKSFTVSTNNYTGYTLRITTADNTGRLNKTTSCNSTDTTRCYIPSITSASSSITTNNTWGYKPSYFNSSTNTSFRPSPNSTGDIINVTSSANATNTSDSYTLQVGTKVDFNVEPGTYSRTFTITAVGNPITYDLEYTDNTGTGGTVGSDVSNLPSSHQTGTINNGVASITLTPYPSAPTTKPTRTGYTFVSWCSVPTTNNGTTCSGTTYTYSSTNQNYGTMNINETVNNMALKLYALWSTNTYAITLTNTNATTSGSTSATATYNSSTLTSITNPQRKYTISGLAANGSGGSGATVTFGTSGVCTSTSSCSYTYGFKGWYTATSSGSLIINTSGALQASTSFTDANSKWTSTSGTTLYAQWNNGTAWATTSTSTTRTYSSGQTGVTLTANATLYGTCTADTYNITLNKNSATNSPTTSTTVTYGATTLGAIATLPVRQYSVGLLLLVNLLIPLMVGIKNLVLLIRSQVMLLLQLYLHLLHILIAVTNGPVHPPKHYMLVGVHKLLLFLLLLKLAILVVGLKPLLVLLPLLMLLVHP